MPIGQGSDYTVSVTGKEAIAGGKEKGVTINCETIGVVVEQEYHQGGCALREGNKIIVVRRRESHISQRVVLLNNREPVKDQILLTTFIHLNRSKHLNKRKYISQLIGAALEVRVPQYFITVK